MSEIASGLICEVVLRGGCSMTCFATVVSRHEQAGHMVPKFQVISTCCPVCSDWVKCPPPPVEFLTQDLEFLLRPHRDKDRVPACPTVGPMGRLGAGV